jgi:putative transposase
MDGHVNNYEIINPFTGAPKRMITVGAIDGRSQYLAGYEIAVTENILSIAAAIRRAILNLGKIPKIIYIDNGKAFTAKYFNGDNAIENLESLFARLGIRVIFAKAYHAQSKPIEPFWGWMAELERLIPTYTGTSIELKPPRMNRGEFLHRKLYEKAMDNTTVDIFAAHRAMAWWLDEYHNREKVSGHLKGLTPAGVFAAGKNFDGILKTDRKTIITKEELNFLMLDHDITTLYRKGIKMFGTWYWHEKLFGKQIDAGDEVHIKYDIFDQSYVLVYDRHGELVCKAYDVKKTHPAASLLGTEEEAEEVKKQLSLKEKLKSSVTGEAKQFLQDEIYPFVKKQLNDANILQLEQASLSQREGQDAAKSVKAKKKRRSVTDYMKAPEERKTKNADLISKAG